MVNVVAIAVAFILQAVVDSGANLDTAALKKNVLFCILLILADMIAIYLNQIANAKYQYHTMRKIKKDVFDSLIDTDINSFQSDNTAKYISIFNNDIKLVQQNFIQTIPSIFSHITQFVFAVTALIYIDPLIALITLTINMLPMIIPAIFGKQLSIKNEENAKTLETYNIKLKDVFSGFEVIKSYHITTKIKQEHDNINDEVERREYRLKKVLALSSAASNGSGDIVFIGILVIATLLVIQGRMTIGMMIACVQLLNYVVNPIGMLANELSSLKSVKKVNERIIETMNLKKDMKSDALDKMSTHTSFKPEYKLESLNYEYEADTPVLKDITLNINQGKKYAIVGGSGCGKSTLLKIMFKYYDNYTGHININDKSLSELSKEELYQNVVMLHQNVFLFDDTLAQNISLYEDYTENEIIDVINRVGLSEKLEELPDGIHSRLDENGQNFSGGERQRIAIARALLRKTPMIFMDEATSSLDAKTAYQIERSVLEDKELTAVIVTHRLSETLLRNYDEIIMMKNGRITEQGSFDYLMNTKQDFFNLYQMSI
jgi:ATP-binding cassette subfamily C protein